MDSDSTPEESAESIGSLISRVNDGDEDAIADLDRRLSSEMLRIVRNNRSRRLQHRIESSEVVNDALRSFVSFVMALDEVSGLDRSDDVRRILMHFTMCKLRDRIRHERRRGRDERRDVAGGDETLAFLASSQPTPEQIVGAEEFFQQLPRLFASVHDRAMSIFELTMEGLSVREIAMEIELSVRSVQAIKRGMEDACVDYIASR